MMVLLRNGRSECCAACSWRWAATSRCLQPRRCVVQRLNRLQMGVH